MSHINFQKKYVWFMTIAFTLLTACSKGGDDPVEAVAVALPPSTEAGPTEEVPSLNPIEAQRWCRVEDWDSFQVVMRAVAVGNHLQIEYLRLTPDAPTVYPIGKSLPYEIRHNLSVIEKNKFTITFQDSLPEIQKLYGYDKQKEIVEKKLTNNTFINREPSQFAPATAITVMNRSVTNGDEEVRHFYPCEQYSTYFNLDGPIRPAIEMNLFLAWNVEDFVENTTQDQLAQSMILTLPIEEIKLAPSELEQTQWCSWHQVGMGNLFLRTLTFSGDRYISNAHTQYFSEIYDESKIMAYLENNAKYSVSFDMTRPEERIGGMKIAATDRPEYYSEELFATVQDGNGTRALVRLNEKNPDDSWPEFSDIYYDCRDPRPLAFSPAFGSRIQTILSLQMNRALPPAPSEPVPAPEQPVPGSEQPVPEVPEP